MQYIDDEEDDILAITATLLLVKKSFELQEKRRKRRSIWTKQWIGERLRKGAYASLVKELRETDTGSYKNFLRMDTESFDMLLAKVAPVIRRQNTRLRLSIPPEERLALTLRWLATGDTFTNLHYWYRIGRTTVGMIIHDTCAAIVRTMQPEYLKIPCTEGEWQSVAKEFMDKWQFPHCIGALDGKHVRMKAPPNTGSLYYNYKHFFSIVLPALVDANYRFLYVDIGGYGRTSDGGVFANSQLSQGLATNRLHVPPAADIEGAKTIPYTIVADDAFPLKTYLMKPYAQRGLTAEQRCFNYRLSRARRCVENAFGILSQRFQIFGRDIPLEPKKVEVVTMAACCLHNFLLRNSKSTAVYTAEINQTACNMQQVSQQGGNRPSTKATEVRDNLCQYFNSDHGAVSWQSQHAVLL